jgi:antitoxin component YwqK of YwqJK toxin-antitoxin module
MKIKFIVSFFVMVFLASCLSNDNEWIQKDENGVTQFIFKGKDPENGCYIFYYENGKVKKTLCLKDSLITGLQRFYFEDGSIKASGFYNSDTIVGFDTIFYNTGEIHELRDGYINKMANGLVRIYSKDGTLKALNLVKDNQIYYIKTYSYDSNKIKSDSAEGYYLIIETEKDTFKVNDTVSVHIYLPECQPPYILDRFVVRYDFYKMDGRTTKYPGPISKGNLSQDGFREKLVFKEKGEILIGTQLDYQFSEDSIMLHGMSDKSIYIIE